MTRRILLAFAVLAAGCQSADAPLPRTTLTDGTGDHWSFAYSPDGGQLGVVRADEDGVRLVIAAADGSSPRIVGAPASFISAPVWAPDSRSVYFASSASGQFGLHVATIGDSVVVSRIAPEHAVAIPGSAHAEEGLLFTVFAGGGGDQYRIPPGGGDPAPILATPRDESVGAWSPDGTQIAYVAARDGREALEVIPTAGGEPVAVGPADGAVRGGEFRWVLDGSAVIVPAAPFGNMDLYVAPVDGSAPRQLTRDIRDDWAPALSPDGEWVAFLSARGGQTDVWIVPFAGGEPSRVTDDADEEISPAWTPDGTGVVFAQGAAPVEVHVVSVADGQSRPLVVAERNAVGAEFSPDGGTVAFRMAHNGVDEIWTVPASGGEPTPLTRDGLKKILFAYSLDGERIYYLAEDGLGTNLYSIPAAGGTPTALTGDAGQKLPYNRLFETADGALIGYLGLTAAGGYDYFVVPTAGGPARAVTSFGSVIYGTLLPDGSAAVVSSYHRTREQAGLVVVPLDGSAPRELETGEGWVFDVLPSPDGGSLAFTQIVEGEITLQVIPTAGGRARRLSAPGTNLASYNWMPDGRSLVAALGAGPSISRLALVRVEDGEVQWLSEPGSSARAGWASPDGGAIVYARDRFRRQVVKVDVSRLLGRP